MERSERATQPGQSEQPDTWSTVGFPASTPRHLRLPLPMLELLGATLTAVSEGEAIVEMDTGEHHTNGLGVVHGGALCTLADAAMGIAYYSTLVEGESFATVELKINYLKPVRTVHLRATGHLIKRGRTLGLVECDVVDDQGTLVARASCTCMTLRGAQDEREGHTEAYRRPKSADMEL